MLQVLSSPLVDVYLCSMNHYLKNLTNQRHLGRLVPIEKHIFARRAPGPNFDIMLINHQMKHTDINQDL